MNGARRLIRSLVEENTMLDRRAVCWTGALLCSMLLPVAALGGDLNPPVGAVAPTMKTLVEVEPRTAIHQADVPLTITTPGSYYLAENLVFPAATTGLVISINASDVTIDLNGFTIDGQDAEGDAFNVFGITVAFVESDIRIHNGSIKGVTFGVNAQSTQRVFVESLRVEVIDVGTGIRMSNLGTADDCEVIGGTLGFDMTVASNAVLRDCIVRDASEAAYNFAFSINGHAERCIAFSSGYGYRLTDTSDDVVIVGCRANSCSIGYSDLSSGTNFFYSNLAASGTIPYQNVANVSSTPNSAGPWVNIQQ